MSLFDGREQCYVHTRYFDLDSWYFICTPSASTFCESHAKFHLCCPRKISSVPPTQNLVCASHAKSRLCFPCKISSVPPMQNLVCASHAKSRLCLPCKISPVLPTQNLVCAAQTESRLCLPCRIWSVPWTTSVCTSHAKSHCTCHLNPRCDLVTFEIIDFPNQQLIINNSYPLYLNTTFRATLCYYRI